VWDGGTARQLGLVDGFGGMQDAVAKAGDLAGLGKGERQLRYLEPPRSFRESLFDSLAAQDDGGDLSSDDAYAVFTGQPQRQFAAALAEVRSILSGPTIQARSLECGWTAAPPPQHRQEDWSLLALLKEWLS
jgi:protease-4